jgi:hypothetical protein
MAKYIPLSIVIFTVVLAGLMASKPRGKQAVKTLHLAMLAYIVVWGFLCLYVYTANVFIE